eukprot:Hpha_TRINITY_DN34169_c0_g1::TRINITY_DN34169_c0_g1_i1::g.75775::m.75775
MLGLLLSCVAAGVVGRRDGPVAPAVFRERLRQGRISEFPDGTPKVLHQTWKSREVRREHRGAVESWGTCLPDEWLQVLWTDEDAKALVAEVAPDFLRTFMSYIHPIQRADTFRYVLLRHYGGWYADVDYECQHAPVQPPPRLAGGDSTCGFYLAQQPRKATASWIERRKYSELAGRHGVQLDLANPNVEPEPRRWPVMNSLMASTPRHPFWSVLLREAESVWGGGRGATRRIFGEVISASTGVTLLSDVFFGYLSQNGTDACVFGCAAWDGEDDGLPPPPVVFARHLNTAVWRQETVSLHVATRARLVTIWVAVALAAAVLWFRGGVVWSGAAVGTVVLAHLVVTRAAAFAYNTGRRGKSDDLLYEYLVTALLLAVEAVVAWRFLKHAAAHR